MGKISQNGDCFKWTGKFVLTNKNSGISPTGENFEGIAKVVHGVFKCVYLDLTIQHAFIQDDKFVYEKKSPRKYSRFSKEEFYSKSHYFNFADDAIETKISQVCEHSFSELHELMRNAGGVFKSFGIPETDY